MKTMLRNLKLHLQIHAWCLMNWKLLPRVQTMRVDGKLTWIGASYKLNDVPKLYCLWEDKEFAMINIRVRKAFDGIKLAFVLLLCGASVEADANPYGARMVVNVPGEALYIWNNPNNCETYSWDYNYDARQLRTFCFKHAAADEMRMSLPASAHITYGSDDYHGWTINTWDNDGSNPRGNGSLWFYNCELVQGFKREYGAPTTENMRSVQCRGEDVFADGMED